MESSPAAESLKANPQSFIVKVWLDDKAEDGGPATWRGQITHVPSGEQRYLTDLEEIPPFVAPYLEQMGIKMGVRWRIRHWLIRALLRPTGNSQE